MANGGGYNTVEYDIAVTLYNHKENAGRNVTLQETSWKHQSQ